MKAFSLRMTGLFFQEEFPKYTFVITNNIIYKNFDLMFFLFMVVSDNM